MKKSVALAVGGVVLLLVVFLGPRPFTKRALAWETLYLGADGDVRVVAVERKGWNRWTIDGSIKLVRSDRTSQMRYSLVKLSGPELDRSEEMPGMTGPFATDRIGVPQVAGWSPEGILVQTTARTSNTLSFWPSGSDSLTPAHELTVQQILGRSRSSRYYLVELADEITLWDCKEWKAVTTAESRRALTKLLARAATHAIRVCDDGVHVFHVPTRTSEWHATAIRADTGETREFGGKLNVAAYCYVRDVEMVDGRLLFIRAMSMSSTAVPALDLVAADGTRVCSIPPELNLWAGTCSWNPLRGVFMVGDNPTEFGPPLLVFDTRTMKMARFSPRAPLDLK